MGLKLYIQIVLSMLVVSVVSLACYIFQDLIGYRVVALVLLATVSLVAMSFSIWPVLLSALVTALIYDFFFLPPKFTLHISSTEDALVLAMYFVIALINGALTHKIRQLEVASRREAEKERTLQLYGTLLNSLSHELRTPLATVIGATDHLQNKAIQISAENRDELLTEISNAAFRLNRQVENLLNMSRLESGFLEPKKDWCDINETIYDVVKKEEEVGATNTFEISINPSLPLYKLDKGLLEQVLYNIIHNASLYTPSGSKVFVQANHYIDRLVITIQDEGQGFPEDEISHVFDKFYRLKSSLAGGTGLGLSIVKGFVEAMDGIVRLENSTDGGARFTVEIPAETSYLNTRSHE